jgi:hypothetical protein
VAHTVHSRVEREEAPEVTAKKRPSLIVMKRLDTMGLRLLSQSVGAGTRRAGVRLSPRGELTPHQRGEPISSAPPPATGDASDDTSPEAAPLRELSVETPAILDATGTLSAELRELASAQLARRIAEGRESAEEAEAADASPMIATGASAAPLLDDAGGAVAATESRARRSTTAWGAALLAAGALTGVLIARVVGGAPPVPDARAQAHLEPASETTHAGVGPARDDGARQPPATQEGASTGAAQLSAGEGATTETPPPGALPSAGLEAPAPALQAEPARDPRREGRGGEAHATPPGPQLEPARAGE